jgi:glycosyltransferase involved in cell wall biosynthesis
MNVLLLDFHRGWGGQPSSVLLLGRELGRRGHGAVIGAPSDSEICRRARALGLPTFEECRFLKPRRVLSFLGDARALAEYARQRRPDIVHATGSQDVWTAALARRWCGLPYALVLTRHNTKRVAWNAANRWLYGRGIDRLAVVSRTVLERYETYIRRGILDPGRVAVLPPSPWFEEFEGDLDPAAMRRELGASEADLLIGVIGRLVPDKGQDDLLRAAVEVRRRLPQARFLLVGTGTWEAHLRGLARALGLEDAARFLGFRRDAPRITAALDLSVLPSVDCDASPTVVKEAMLLGKPVVATSIGGAKEILEDGVSGRIVPPRRPDLLAEAIVAVLSDREAARRMGAAGRERVRALFAHETMVRSHLAFYQQVLEERGRGQRPGLEFTPPPRYL